MKTYTMTSRQLAIQKLEQLKRELTFELEILGATTGSNRLQREQNVFLLSVQINALEKNINFKNK